MSGTLLDALKMASSAAIDGLRDLAAMHGTEAVVSIVIGHPGTAEDAFVVGQHETAELFAILTRLETGPSVQSDVSATFVGPDEPSPTTRMQ